MLSPCFLMAAHALYMALVDAFAHGAVTFSNNEDIAHTISLLDGTFEVDFKASLVRITGRMGRP